MSSELALLVIATAGASVAALFAILCFFRKQLPDALTARGATQILRAETDIVRGAVEDQARGLRHELGQSLKGDAMPMPKDEISNLRSDSCANFNAACKQPLPSSGSAMPHRPRRDEEFGVPF